MARSWAMASCIAFVLVASGCQSESPRDYALKVSDFHGVGGETLIYDITNQDATITLLTDTQGTNPKILWRAKLTADQRTSIRKCLRELELDRLKDSYVNPNAFDGLELTYQIEIENHKPRKIVLSNVEQPDLAKLTEAINLIVPDKYRIGGPLQNSIFN
jgi:hypothetical protein